MRMMTKMLAGAAGFAAVAAAAQRQRNIIRLRYTSGYSASLSRQL